MEYLVRPATVPDDYPRLVEIWRSAVAATHDFLAPRDRAAIESSLFPDYLPHVALHVAEKDGRAVGFYRHRGFAVVGRSAIDGDGRPYPLLHLASTVDRPKSARYAQPHDRLRLLPRAHVRAVRALTS